jgi:class 3 adenylate cyclase
MSVGNARVERRLAAIMAADIVGYSRLIEADEAFTLTAVRRLRSEVLDPLFAEHRGRVVKLMGDHATEAATIKKPDQEIEGGAPEEQEEDDQLFLNRPRSTPSCAAITSSIPADC